MVVRLPIGSVLSDVLFEASAFSKVPFYINFFVQPLYVPSEHLMLSFGERVLGQWDYDASKIEELANRVFQAKRDQALPFFDLFGTPGLLYKNLPKAFL